MTEIYLHILCARYLRMATIQLPREIMSSTAEVGRPAVPPPSPRVSAVDKAVVAEEKIRLGQLRNEVADLEVRALLG